MSHREPKQQLGPLTLTLDLALDLVSVGFRSRFPKLFAQHIRDTCPLAETCSCLTPRQFARWADRQRNDSPDPGLCQANGISSRLSGYLSRALKPSEARHAMPSGHVARTRFGSIAGASISIWACSDQSGKLNFMKNSMIRGRPSVPAVSQTSRRSLASLVFAMFVLLIASAPVARPQAEHRGQMGRLRF